MLVYLLVFGMLVRAFVIRGSCKSDIFTLLSKLRFPFEGLLLMLKFLIMCLFYWRRCFEVSISLYGDFM